MSEAPSKPRKCWDCGSKDISVVRESLGNDRWYFGFLCLSCQLPARWITTVHEDGTETEERLENSWDKGNRLGR